MRTKVGALLALLALLTALATGTAGAEGGPAPAPGPPSTSASPPAEAVLGGIRAMSTGYYVSCALLQNGQVRCSGDGTEGSLGNGDTDDHTRAVVVRNPSGTGPLTNVVAIAGGAYHFCGLLTSGQVRCWGDGAEGQLGNGNPNDRLLPTTVKNPAGNGPLTGVQSISADGYHTCAVLQSGQVRCWGDNEYGQIGDGTDTTDRFLPRVVKSVAGTGPLTGVTQVEAGYYNTCVRLANGQARCWGYNEYSISGDDDTSDLESLPQIVQNVPGTGPLTSVRRISVGGYHACAVMNNGQARCWGYNTDGVIGDGTDDTRYRPTVVENGNGSAALSGIRYLDAGYYHTCALLTNKQVRCWGENVYDAVGNGIESGPDVVRPTPVRNAGNTGNLVNVLQLQTSDYHTCVTLTNHQARCWGYDEEGALGNGGDSQSPLPVKFTT